jgi:hypothetical protein
MTFGSLKNVGAHLDSIPLPAHVVAIWRVPAKESADCVVLPSFAPRFKTDWLPRKSQKDTRIIKASFCVSWCFMWLSFLKSRTETCWLSWGRVRFFHDRPRATSKRFARLHSFRLPRPGLICEIGLLNSNTVNLAIRTRCGTSLTRVRFARFPIVETIETVVSSGWQWFAKAFLISLY